jgi:hypothetical protein
VLRIGLDVYRAIGLTRADGQMFSATVADETLQAEANWGQSGGSPVECQFTIEQAPLGTTFAERSASTDDDRVHYPSWHSDADQVYWLTEGVRLFDDSAAATSYLADLQTAISVCPSYAMPGSGWAASVTASEALDVPPSVAAYGWVEVGGIARFYAVDLQRGNLVLRLTLSSGPEGPSEDDFRAFAESYARLLAAMEPSGPLTR